MFVSIEVRIPSHKRSSHEPVLAFFGSWDETVTSGGGT
jgi:hypothetical protein